MLENKNYLQYLLGIVLSILVIPIFSVTLLLIPNIGWHLLTVIYITILIFQIIFYYLTTKHNLAWTILSFIMNFSIWTLEQVTIEKYFHDSFIYKYDNLNLNVLILGGALWTTNKIIIDKLFDFNKSIFKKKSKLEIEQR